MKNKIIYMKNGACDSLKEHIASFCFLFYAENS